MEQHSSKKQLEKNLPPAHTSGTAGTGETLTGNEVSPVPKERVLLPAVLFFATCLSTFWVGAVNWKPFTHLDTFEHAWTIFGKTGRNRSSAPSIKRSPSWI